MSCWAIVLVLVATTIVGSPAAGWAHPAPSGMRVQVAPPPALPSVLPGRGTQPVLSSLPAAAIDEIVVVVLGLGLAAVLTAGRRRARHLPCVGISLVLILVGFAGAVHSVHHMGDSQAGDRCVLAASAEHVSGMDTDGAPFAVFAAKVVGRACAGPPAVARDLWRAPTRGRAPPA